MRANSVLLLLAKESILVFAQNWSTSLKYRSLYAKIKTYLNKDRPGFWIFFQSNIRHLFANLFKSKRKVTLAKLNFKGICEGKMSFSKNLIDIFDRRAEILSFWLQKPVAQKSVNN